MFHLLAIAHAAPLDVCSTCTYPTITAALAAASANDVIDLTTTETIVEPGPITLGFDLVVRGVPGATVQVPGATTIGAGAIVAIEEITFDGVSTWPGLDVSDGGVLNLTEVALTDHVDGNGAGLSVATNASATWVGGLAQNNLATTHGGGAAVHGTFLQIGVDMMLNDANTGGALYIDADIDVTLIDASIDNNDATVDGGGIYWTAPAGRTLSVVDSAVVYNLASTGAGGGIAADGQGSLVLDDDHIGQNNAPHGAGVWADGLSSVTGARNVLCANIASSNGGAMALDNVDSVDLRNQFFIANQTTSGSGGALRFTGGGTYAVAFSHFLDNSAPAGNGAAVYGDGVTISHSVVAFHDDSEAISGVGMLLVNSTTWSNANVGGSVSGEVISFSNPLQGYFGGVCSSVSDTDLEPFRPKLGSSMHDSAGVGGFDPDGSVADLGAFGGPDADPSWWEDEDGDGIPWTHDCDDDDPLVFPTGLELACDGVDNNCDGIVDFGGSTPTWYADDDGDGYGDFTRPMGSSCVPVDGASWQAFDCDDTDPDRNPNTIWYDDDDGDGFGETEVQQGCIPWEATYSTESGDCDDGNVYVFPGAPELCDGDDNDCNGIAEDDETTDWYLDDDNDSWGTAFTVSSCTIQPGSALRDGDCDDTDPRIHPNTAWGFDIDGDGWAGTIEEFGCVPTLTGPGIYGDCDEGTVLTHPGAPELCDGFDNDCDLQYDEDVVDIEWFTDDDLDGYYGTSAGMSCSVIVGASPVADDCDDTAGDTFPGAPEQCDGADNDCDGTVDEGTTGGTTWYLDNDADGYGDATNPIVACAQPSNAVAVKGDCHDFDDAINPEADELCDGVDNDCDTIVDLDAIDMGEFYADDDNDGWGSGPAFEACVAPPGFQLEAGDCDDHDSLVNPDQAERCDGIDNDCDGTADGDAIDAEDFWPDKDGDGYGDPAEAIALCQVGEGYVKNDADCDDTRADVFPGAVDVADDTLDQDCSGVDTRAVMVGGSSCSTAPTTWSGWMWLLTRR